MRAKPTILVVEDDTAVVMMITYLLSREGCEVKAAFTGRAGMELATTRKFDLILMDVDLGSPNLNGFDICLELKQRHISYRTPIIMLSGNGTEERREKAFEVGAADFIEKPFEAFDFVSRVLSSIRERALA